MRGWIAAATVATAIGVVAGVAQTASAQDVGTITVTGVDLVDDTVELTNNSDSEVDVNGLVLCNFPAYAPIDGADPIAPGASITVDVGAAGVALGDDDGEFGLYTSNSFEDPDAIIAYVEWGSAGHQRSSVAVAAGIWDGEAVAAAPSLSASVSNPRSAADWATGAAGSSDDAPRLAETGAGTWIIASIAGALVALGLGAGAMGRRTRAT